MGGKELYFTVHMLHALEAKGSGLNGGRICALSRLTTTVYSEGQKTRTYESSIIRSRTRLAFIQAQVYVIGMI